jgi:hypothetical protein
MDTGKEKTPQEELEELLRQAGGQAGGLPGRKSQGPVVRPAAMAAGALAGARQGMARIDGKWWLIGGLALVLLIGTIFFLSALSGPKDSGMVLSTNEPGIKLTLGNRIYGSVDSGFELALRPGDYALTATKEGFLTFEAKATVSRGKFTDVSIVLLPIPELKNLGSGWNSPRLSADGTEVSFIDSSDSRFKTRLLADETLAPIFRGSFSEIKEIVWAPTGQMAIVQFSNVPSFANSLDNRNAPGRYIPLGERPEQAPPLSRGGSTWLFDDAGKTSEGWQPIRLNENIRQVAFAPDGSGIIYIYEAADGEYSLVSAQPDGLEWERVIGEMPRLTNPKLTWGPDSRYLFIVDGDKVYTADLLAESVEQVFTDWIVDSDIRFSPSGNQLAYWALENEKTVLKVYDLLDRQSRTVPDINLAGAKRLVWIGLGHVLVVGEDQAFRKIDIESGSQSLIPFSGTTLTGTIDGLDYSILGHVLMIVASGNIYYMRI